MAHGKEEGGGGGGGRGQPGAVVLELWPPSKKDFWRKTYYTPPLIKDDGPLLASQLGGSSRVTMQVTLDISRSPGAQFDQAGLMVRLDSEHWIKAGIEVVDDRPRLSCVVTNGHSDWSTQPWGSTAVRVRVSQTGDGSYVVEAQPSETDAQTPREWTLMRICYLQHVQSHAHVQLGVFGCCPERQNGCLITFTEFSIREGVQFEHNADGNQE